MKKLILTFLLFLSVIGTASAPPDVKLNIPISNPIVYIDVGFYEPLIDAMFTYEASRNPFAINDMEQAYGGLQIRQNRLDHYNCLNNTNYILTDCFDFQLSKKIFLYFTNHDSKGKEIPYKTWEQAAKDWNGSGDMTITYWENVNKLIQNILT